MKYKSMIERSTNNRFMLIVESGVKIYENIEPVEYKRLRKLWKNALMHKEKNEVMESLGLTKVYGAQSGRVYWE